MDTSDSKAAPKRAIRGIGGGLLLMGLFTACWAGIAGAGLTGISKLIIWVLFGIFCLLFIIFGIYIFSVSKNYPTLTSEGDKKEGKRLGKRFGIVFGIEGAAICIMWNVLAPLNLIEYGIPGMALIVGLHFYPMAKIFHRKIDYYIATWGCLVALTGLLLTAMNKPQELVFALVGIGMAFTTTAYGIFMIRTWSLMKPANLRLTA